MNEDKNTYSIALRVRRTINEDAYISVPLTEAITKQNEDGTLGIDYEKFIAKAIELSQNLAVEWQIESSDILAHPMQTPKPEERKSYLPDDFG